MNNALFKFQELLRELFQFDCADLDFGIYRIMNHKRDVVEKFIKKTLPKTVTDELDHGTLAAQSQAVKELEAAKKKVLEGLAEDALDAEGNLIKKYHDTKAGKEYLAARAKAAGTRGRDALEATIYNHLYAFFSRYYQDGDFISKRRYSKRERYAIPYNGEEVYLYWANHDQYYVKTAEYFTDYAFTSPNGVNVHFKLKAADLEQNNVKGEKRFFLPRPAEVAWDEPARNLVIPFEYRPLTEQENIAYGQKNQQEAIIAKANDGIPKRLSPKTAGLALSALTAERRKTGDGEPITFLEHHLGQYTRRNTSDFFIHKDLKRFLSRELDFYLKNEVLNLDEVEASGEDRAEGWFQMMRIIKAIGDRIIEFLHQIEEFQKTLWEKRKFITETGYCITVGNIDENFYAEIAACDAQWDEWKALFHIDEEKNDLFTLGKSKKDKRIAFLKAHPTLVVDTKHFDQPFKDRLLESFEKIEDFIDGVLIQSDNFHALNLMVTRHRHEIKCIYIDPPYNTDASAIVYKNDYKDSSWLCLMESRLLIAQHLLQDSGILCAAIDDEEVLGLRFLLSGILPREIGIAVVRSNPAGRKTKGRLAPAHEYALFFGKSIMAIPESLEKTEKSLARYPHQDEKGRFAWANFIRSGSNDKREDRPKLFYPIFAGKDDTIRIPQMEWNAEKGEYALLEKAKKDEVAVYPVVKKNGKTIEKNWQRGHVRVAKELDEFRVRRDLKGEINIDFKTRMDEQSLPITWWDKKEYASANYGAAELKDLFGAKLFDFAKSRRLVEDCITAAGVTEGREMVLDFFAGSGTTAHAVISLNRTNGSNHRFVLIDVEEYFDSVIVKRVKKAVFAPEWSDGKPKRMATAEEAERSPRIVKYIRLESYEDALNNIAFDDASGQQAMKFDDYLLQYMLKWETRKSETLLNVEKLANPFNYKLHIHADGQTREKLVDIQETFNYLLGLHIQTRRVYDDEGRHYLVYRGRIDHRNIAVIWRDTEGWQKLDFERDKEFVVKQKLTEDADEVFVNGDSLIPGARALEPIFKARMFAPVEA
jgi:adenine-specific DNA-methyltransferase